MEPLQHI